MIEAGVSSSLMGSTVEISPDFYLGFKPNEIIALAKWAKFFDPQILLTQEFSKFII